MTRWTWHDTAFLVAIIGLTLTGVSALAMQVMEHYRVSIIPVTTCVGVAPTPKAMSVNPFARGA